MDAPKEDGSLRRKERRHWAYAVFTVTSASASIAVSPPRAGDCRQEYRTAGLWRILAQTSPL